MAVIRRGHYLKKRVSLFFYFQFVVQDMLNLGLKPLVFRFCKFYYSNYIYIHSCIISIDILVELNGFTNFILGFFCLGTFCKPFFFFLPLSLNLVWTSGSLFTNDQYIIS